MKVKFSYKIWKDQLSATINVDDDEWEEMSSKERLDYLADKIYDSIKIVQNTIEES